MQDDRAPSRTNPRDRAFLLIGTVLEVLSLGVVALSAVAGNGRAHELWKGATLLQRCGAVLILLVVGVALLIRKRKSAVEGFRPWMAPIQATAFLMMVVGFFSPWMVTALTGLTHPMHVMVGPIVLGMALFFVPFLVSFDQIREQNPGPAKPCEKCRQGSVPPARKCPLCGDTGRIRGAALHKAFVLGAAPATFAVFLMAILGVNQDLIMPIYGVLALGVGIPVYRSALRKSLRDRVDDP